MHPLCRLIQPPSRSLNGCLPLILANKLHFAIHLFHSIQISLFHPSASRRTPPTSTLPACQYMFMSICYHLNLLNILLWSILSPPVIYCICFYSRLFSSSLIIPVLFPKHLLSFINFLFSQIPFCYPEITPINQSTSLTSLPNFCCSYQIFNYLFISTQ